GRRRLRHQLSGAGTAERPATDNQPAFGDCARHPAQDSWRGRWNRGARGGHAWRSRRVSALSALTEALTGRDPIEYRPHIRPHDAAQISDGWDGGWRARRLRAHVFSLRSFKRLWRDFDGPRRLGREGFLR